MSLATLRAYEAGWIDLKHWRHLHSTPSLPTDPRTVAISWPAPIALRLGLVSHAPGDLGQPGRLRHQHAPEEFPVTHVRHPFRLSEARPGWSMGAAVPWCPARRRGDRVALGLFSRPSFSTGSGLDPNHAPCLDWTPANRGYPQDAAHTQQIVLSNSSRIACVSRVQVAPRSQFSFRFCAWDRFTS